MANIAITSLCNRSCSCCFAKASSDSDVQGARFMTRGTFERALAFLDRSEIGQTRVLGGEPSLHPELPLFLKLALDRGKPIHVFSNGSLPEATLRLAEAQPADRITFVINLTASSTQAGGDREAVIRVLGRLGERSMIGVNVSRPSGWLGPSPAGDGIAYLLDLVDHYGLRRDIRVGLAHPCVGFDNTYLHPKTYAAVGWVVARLWRCAAERSVRLTLDCGFAPCLAPGLLPESAECVPEYLRGHCGPVLDILPDARVIPCFPLARVESEQLDDWNTASDLRAHFERRLAGYRQLGVLRECANCALRKRGLCTGGCLAAAMRRLETASLRLEA